MASLDAGSTIPLLSLSLYLLQDRVPAFSNKEAFSVVELELGVPFEDVYELVEPEPIAAASIGQASDKVTFPPPVLVLAVDFPFLSFSRADMI